MDEQESLSRFGLHPGEADLEEIRSLLLAQAEKEAASQGLGDTELMKLCCVQLFNAGRLDDCLLIWRAKTSSMDADASIDIQLLCGQGVEETKSYLRSQAAELALERLVACENSGDFDGFCPKAYSDEYSNYYTDEEP